MFLTFEEQFYVVKTILRSAKISLAPYGGGRKRGIPQRNATSYFCRFRDCATQRDNMYTGPDCIDFVVANETIYLTDWHHSSMVDDWTQTSISLLDPNSFEQLAKLAKKALRWHSKPDRRFV